MCLAQSIVPDSFCPVVYFPLLRGVRTPGLALTTVLSQFLVLLVSYLNIYCYRPLTPEGNFTPFQLGFRKGMGCVQAHHIVGRLMKQAVAQKSPLYCLTVDISSAFF